MYPNKTDKSASKNWQKNTRFHSAVGIFDSYPWGGGKGAGVLCEFNYANL